LTDRNLKVTVRAGLLGFLIGLFPVFSVLADETVSWKLPKRLNEVSGLALSVDGRVFIHNDEKAIVYELDPLTGDISSILKIGDPALRADFEDIALLGEDIYLITSTGTLHRIENSLNFHETVAIAEITETGLSDICELEGLSAFRGKLFLACKTNFREMDKLQLLVFLFDPIKKTTIEYLRVSHDELDREKMSPSGIAVTEEVIYLVSARQRLLTRVTHGGHLISNHKLKKKQHHQPEGIAVAVSGRLYLADEGKGKGGRVTIYESISDIP
jgi:uncharacterized protein YjiK|tara:strand:- start:1022 stop:1837 length:816 start_codon:yes stop_codon:yes gene_type:complete